MRVLVCGSREFSDEVMLFTVLDRIHADTPITCVIEGEAQGADLKGRTWARLRGVPIAPYPAQWGRYGRGAGMMRNRQMLYDGKPDLVVSFKVQGVNKNRGTNHMIAISKALGVPVEEHYEPSTS